jgi:hypothetical protein
VLRDVEEHQRRDAYYSVKKLKPRRDLGDLPGDQEALWELTARCLGEGSTVPSTASDPLRSDL